MSMPYLAGLRLAGRRVVVIGAGSVASRRMPMLIESGADITVIAPEATPEIARLALRGQLEWQQRPYRTGDLADAWYVLVATDDSAANAAVSARGRGAAHLLRTRRSRRRRDGLDAGHGRTGRSCWSGCSRAVSLVGPPRPAI